MGVITSSGGLKQAIERLNRLAAKLDDPSALTEALTSSLSTTLVRLAPEGSGAGDAEPGLLRLGFQYFTSSRTHGSVGDPAVLTNAWKSGAPAGTIGAFLKWMIETGQGYLGRRRRAMGFGKPLSKRAYERVFDSKYWRLQEAVKRIKSMTPSKKRDRLLNKILRNSRNARRRMERRRAKTELRHELRAKIEAFVRDPDAHEASLFKFIAERTYRPIKSYRDRDTRLSKRDVLREITRTTRKVKFDNRNVSADVIRERSRRTFEATLYLRRSIRQYFTDIRKGTGAELGFSNWAAGYRAYNERIFNRNKAKLEVAERRAARPFERLKIFRGRLEKFSARIGSVILTPGKYSPVNRAILSRSRQGLKTARRETIAFIRKFGSRRFAKSAIKEIKRGTSEMLAQSRATEQRIARHNYKIYTSGKINAMGQIVNKVLGNPNAKLKALHQAVRSVSFAYGKGLEFAEKVKSPGKRQKLISALDTARKQALRKLRTPIRKEYKRRATIIRATNLAFRKEATNRDTGLYRAQRANRIQTFVSRLGLYMRVRNIGTIHSVSVARLGRMEIRSAPVAKVYNDIARSNRQYTFVKPKSNISNLSFHLSRSSALKNLRRQEGARTVAEFYRKMALMKQHGATISKPKSASTPKRNAPTAPKSGMGVNRGLHLRTPTSSRIIRTVSRKVGRPEDDYQGA